MDWFQQAVGAYLKDYDTLSAAISKRNPATPEECRASIDALNETLTLLNTKGRARFNIRARQADLAKLEQELRKPVPDDGGNVMDEIDAQLQEYRFAEIVDLLSKQNGGAQGGKRQAVLRIAQAGQVFFADIEAALRGKAFSLPMKLEDGTAVTSLIIPEGEDRIMAKLASGIVREVRWQEFPPDQLLALHDALWKASAARADDLRHRTSAIAFDWLSGDRKRAVQSAVSLSETSENFKKLWNAISADLPE